MTGFNLLTSGVRGDSFLNENFSNFTAEKYRFFTAWQPIPVHTLPETEDNLLSSHSDCQKQNYLVDHLNDLPEIKAINDNYDWVYKYLTEKTGANITT